MKRIILIVVAVLFAAGTASAQESRHAIEITTGYVGIPISLEGPGFGYGWNVGKSVIKDYYPYGINVGYTLSLGNRWEVSAQGNVHLNMFVLAQYPMVPGCDPHDPDYDFDADPISTERVKEFGYAAALSVRYKWLVREGFSLYSALGGGFSFEYLDFPFPYIAPVGIKFGKGRVYGLIEANISPLNTFGMAGLGVRL